MESIKQGLQWGWHRLDNMEPVLLYDMLAFRESIFVVEQNCIYHELDGRDKTALHLLASHENQVVACLRVVGPGGQGSRTRIGRVAVAMRWRKRGIARVMVQMAIDKAQQEYPSSRLYLEAQSYLQGFYETFGFQDCGPEFLEDGIPHIPMLMRDA